VLAARSRRGYNLRVLTTRQPLWQPPDGGDGAKTIRVRVLFFGRLKEIAGRADDEVELVEGAPIESVFALYSAQYPELARYRGSLVASRNQEFAAWSTPLHAGDEIGFLPPVSGG
jgi:molybdopterin converting factor small subunit